MKNFLKELAPMLAGFNLAAAFVGFFGIGAFASWVLESWRPFTHWIWDSFFKWLQWPALSDLEKDALTAVLFFLPMGVWSIVRRYRKGKDGPFSVITISVATIAAASFLYLVAGTLIIETLQISLETIRNNNLNQSGVKSKPNAYITIISSLMALTASLIPLYFRYESKVISALKEKSAYQKNKKTEPPILEEGSAIEIESESVSDKIAVEKAILREEKAKSRRQTIFLAATLTMMVSSFGILFGVIENIGWIRGISITAVVLSLFFTLKYDPRRILVTTGAFSAFIISSIGFELALWIVEKMKTLPAT
ncbi:hypothetical protein N9W89_12510 [Hellea sp.]|nr:hypothetical protein [Hellea sp.]